MAELPPLPEVTGVVVSPERLPDRVWFQYWRALDRVIRRLAGVVTAGAIQLPTSAAPATPVNGEMWFDGAALKIRIGGVTRTVTVT